VDDDVAVVEEDPAAGGVALGAEKGDALVLEVAQDAVGDGLELAVARRGAEDEEVGDLREGADVEDSDVLGLELVADAGAGDGEFL